MRLRRPTRSVPPDPDCHEVAAVLQSYLDGELADRDAGRVAEHLEHCHRCDIEATTVQQVIDAIQRQRPALDAASLARLTGVIDELTGGPQAEGGSQHGGDEGPPHAPTGG